MTCWRKAVLLRIDKMTQDKMTFDKMTCCRQCCLTSCRPRCRSTGPRSCLSSAFPETGRPVAAGRQYFRFRRWENTSDRKSLFEAGPIPPRRPSWCQYYKTFYGPKLRLFIIS
jgi:hypothetical protein